MRCIRYHSSPQHYPIPPRKLRLPLCGPFSAQAGNFLSRRLGRTRRGGRRGEIGFCIVEIAVPGNAGGVRRVGGAWERLRGCRWATGGGEGRGGGCGRRGGDGRRVEGGLGFGLWKARGNAGGAGHAAPLVLRVGWVGMSRGRFFFLSGGFNDEHC